MLSSLSDGRRRSSSLHAPPASRPLSQTVGLFKSVSSDTHTDPAVRVSPKAAERRRSCCGRHHPLPQHKRGHLCGTSGSDFLHRQRCVRLPELKLILLGSVLSASGTAAEGVQTAASTSSSNAGVQLKFGALEATSPEEPLTSARTLVLREHVHARWNERMSS